MPRLSEGEAAEPEPTWGCSLAGQRVPFHVVGALVTVGARGGLRLAPSAGGQARTGLERSPGRAALEQGLEDV